DPYPQRAGLGGAAGQSSSSEPPGGGQTERMSGSHETIDVRQDGRRVFLTLDRPEVLNAQNEAFLRELLDVTSSLLGRDDFDAVALRSSCDHWGAGLDLKAVAEGWR